MTSTNREVLPVADLVVLDLSVSWTYIPRRNNCSQLVLDETQVYWCFPKISGKYFRSKANGRGFRIEHVGVTGTLPIEMNGRFKFQLSRAIIRKVKGILEDIYIPNLQIDLIEAMEGSDLIGDRT